MFWKIDYGDICQLIRDTCLFTSRDMGYLVTPPPPYNMQPHIVRTLLNVYQMRVQRAFNSYCTNGSFFLVRYIKLGIVHCAYGGVTGYNFQIKSVFLTLNIIFALANSADPDEMSHYAAFRLGLHYLPKDAFRSHWYRRVNCYKNANYPCVTNGS